MRLQVEKPGKLYIAGEYAVVYGKPAIIIPTSKTVKVTIEDSPAYILGEHEFDRDSFEGIDDVYHRDALAMAHAVVGSASRPYRITMESDLELSNHPKLGFGTSGAITVGLIDAVLRFHGMDATPLVLFKLAVLAQHTRHPHSSYGDVAVSAFQMPMVYRRPDVSAIQNQSPQDIITSPNAMWTGLKIEPFTMPDVPLLVVHTGVAANSQALVEAVGKHRHTEAFQRFLRLSETLVKELVDYPDRLRQMVWHLHALLQGLQSLTEVTLVTPEMERIHSRLEGLDATMKFSGSGGGDAVIIACKDDETKAFVKSKLTQDFTVLDAFF